MGEVEITTSEELGATRCSTLEHKELAHQLRAATVNRDIVDIRSRQASRETGERERTTQHDDHRVAPPVTPLHSEGTRDRRETASDLSIRRQPQPAGECDRSTARPGRHRPRSARSRHRDDAEELLSPEAAADPRSGKSRHIGLRSAFEHGDPDGARAFESSCSTPHAGRERTSKKPG